MKKFRNDEYKEEIIKENNNSTEGKWRVVNERNAARY